MEVFISWSGQRSLAVATTLKNWLPLVINALKPWLSSSDIEKGARWAADIASKLASSKAGIICLTPSNLHSDWILFEAGAISKTVDSTFVCPFLIGIEPSDVEGPLAQFQATTTTKADVFNLLRTLNSALGEQGLSDNHISESFEAFWPKLEDTLKNLPEEKSAGVTRRNEREILEEILDLVRTQNRFARLDAILAGQREPDPAFGSIITDVDQWRLVKAQSIIYKVPGLSLLGTLVVGATIEMHLRAQGGAHFLVKIPRNATIEEVQNTVTAQIAEQVRNLNQDKGTNPQ